MEVNTQKSPELIKTSKAELKLEAKTNEKAKSGQELDPYKTYILKPLHEIISSEVKHPTDYRPK